VTAAKPDCVTRLFAAYTRPSLLLGFVTLLLHICSNGGYGFFRDELYFIVCGNRPDWGYVDQPPLIPLLAAWSHALFGNSLTGFRIAPGLAMAGTVAMTAEFARLIGGGRFAQWLCGLCVMCTPALLALGVFFSTDMLQPLTWLALSWCIVWLAQTGDQRWWIAFWIVAGGGLWSKYLIGFYVIAIGLGMLATPLRSSLARPWFYAGAAVAFAMIAPNILWQYHNGWPFLELASALGHGKNRALPPVDFLAQQVLVIGPLAAPVWIAGLWKSAVRPACACYRLFAIAYALLITFFIVAHGKANYLVPVYPVLFASGAVFWEAALISPAARIVPLVAIAIEGIVFAPLALPIFPEEAAISYMAAMGIGPRLTSVEVHKEGRMPQHFGDMHGWPELAEKVADIYRALPPDDRAKAVFFGRNYGDAAAIDVFGPRLGLPPAISAHNNYYLWGPRGYDGSVMIVLGGDPRWYAKMFRSVDVAGHTDNPYAQPSEIQPIYVLRGPQIPLGVIWPALKRYG
jgi:Dolichyl-phosphate-mannose-protein mannosyltransferase